ncbi:unnamed protein product [Parnassius mnemosyne]|uniref:Ku domain-containing protein n=1 Tax=Parnassius mnemosyne TaxID=213953 RepID=A0AAV1KY27_9NEOP
MPPKVEQGTIIILDIGRNTSAKDKSGKSFFENAIECTKRIIERKIMSQGNDLIGIILLGSKKTKNSMAEQCPGAFKHIELFVELEIPSWKMIRDLPDMPTKSKGDWFDALIVAADYFKNGVSGIKNPNKRIILMTNFESPSSVDENGFDQALNGFKEEDFQVDVIGCDINSENSKNNDINMARNFVESTNGVTAPFNDTMRYLLFHKKKHVNAMPWNVDLCIGPNIKIPITSYIRLKDEPIVKKWTKAVRDPITDTASSTEAVSKKTIHLNVENKNVVNNELIKGYHYGQEIIPFFECDKSLIYESGPKSLIVYGFTHSSKVKFQNLNGDGLSYVFGRKGDKKAQYAVRCLVECLLELDLVAIVRRVYNNGYAPRMFALMPVLDSNDFVCLSMASICFKEEIKYMSFPATELKKFACTNDQVNAFKDLIKAMDLTNAYDDSEFDDNEAFPIAETISPSAQYILDCIAFRAMNPGKPLPQPRSDIMMLFKVPPLIEKRAAVPLERLKTLFVLNKVEVKHRIKKSQDASVTDTSIQAEGANEAYNDMPKVELCIPTKSENIQKIRTISPISDYKYLLSKGKPLNEIALEMTGAIESLIYSNLDQHCSKALEAMMFFRMEGVKGDPSYYNNWLKNFKTELYDRKRSDMLELIKEKQLNYIWNQENNLSKYDINDPEEESQIYEMDTAPSFTEMDVSSEVNNLFNDM